MQTVEDIRLANLNLLREQWGGAATLGKKIGLSASFLAQLKSKHRPFTEKTARKIERKLDLPSGWLDGPQNVGQGIAHIDAALLSKAVKAVGDALEQSKTKATPDQFAHVVTIVYEAAADGGGVRDRVVRGAIALIK